MNPPLLDQGSLAQYEWLDVPMWVFDPQRMRKVWANAAGVAYWRAASLDELLARDYSDASDGARARLRAVQQAVSDGGVVRETWTLFPVGVPATCMLASRGVRLAGGDIAVLFAAERQPATIDPTTLRGVEAVQRTTVRISLHALPDGKALMQNPSAMTAFGQTAFAAMFEDPGLGERITRHVAKGQIYKAELRLNTAAGPAWHALDARPVLDPVSGERTMLLNARDIDELKQVQRALEQARAAADDANMAKTAFLAHISHEIRTPMNGVLGMTELALMGELDDEQRQYIALAHQSAQGLMVIINDLLDVAKIESGRMVLESAPLSLRGCLTEALSPLLVTARDKAVRLTWSVSDELPDRVLGDATRLRQIIVNLAGNAVKFTQDGEVDVSVLPQRPGPDDGPGAAGVGLRLVVRDTGIGMSDEQLDRVFKPFVQADSTITRRYGGTGLGLTIVERLVALMEGGIEVHSRQGHGTTFTVTLRLQRA